MNTKYYTRQQVLDTGIPQVSLDRWSRQFRGTPLVLKRQGQRLLYSEDFVRFVRARMGKVGPANLLYLEPTGYPSTMVGFPYDDVDGWRGIYPAEVLAGQFERVASGWQKGLATWKETIGGIEGPRERANAHNDLGVAEAAGLHFDSVANQIRFILARNAVRSGSLPQVEADAAVATMRTKALAEMQNAERLFALTRQDPRIGVEAFDHCYGRPLVRVEKVVDCEHILQGLSRGRPD